jgi:hypothetical protein
MASSGRANSVPAAVNRQTSLDPLCNPDVKPDAAAVRRVSDSTGGTPLPKVKLYTPRKERMASSGRANSVPAAVNRQTSLDPLCNPDVKPDAAAVGDARVSDSPGGTPYSSGFYQPTSTAAPAGPDRQAPLESLCNPDVKPSDAPDASATAGRETALERARAAELRQALLDSGFGDIGFCDTSGPPAATPAPAAAAHLTAATAAAPAAASRENTLERARAAKLRQALLLDSDVRDPSALPPAPAAAPATASRESTLQRARAAKLRQELRLDSDFGESSSRQPTPGINYPDFEELDDLDDTVSAGDANREMQPRDAARLWLREQEDDQDRNQAEVEAPYARNYAEYGSDGAQRAAAVETATAAASARSAPAAGRAESPSAFSDSAEASPPPPPRRHVPGVRRPPAVPPSAPTLPNRRQSAPSAWPTVAPPVAPQFSDRPAPSAAAGPPPPPPPPPPPRPSWQRAETAPNYPQTYRI